MIKDYLILFMIFAHIIDDYVFQGVLAKLKTKDFWKENVPDRLYRFDYIMALIMHSLSWSFMIHLPIMISYGVEFANFIYISFTANAIIHGYIDDLKANRKKINLIHDQIIHLLQIFIINCFIWFVL